MFISRLTRSLFIIFILSMFFSTPIMAEEYMDKAALAGLSEGKGVFLVDTTSPEKTAFYLDIIKGTYVSMSDQGVKPEMIVVYIGPAVKFLSTTPTEELKEKGESLKAIAATVKELKRLGITQEICAIATEVFQIPNDTLLPELNIIGNGFNSLIGYQNKGYALVPIF